MARRRTIRLSQDDLNYSGANTSHAFQREMVAHMLKYNWSVSGVYREGYNTLVVMRHNHDSSVGAAVYPDGGFVRSPKAKVTWNWQRVRDAASATIPAESLKRTREGVALAQKETV